jgi:CheY-like chemotaxis protein
MSSVLIVDDDAHIARVLSIWLRRHGYHVMCAGDGLEALEVMRDAPIDLLITDVNMPGLDGVGLVRAVRDEGGCDFPIFALTARCDREGLENDLRSRGVRFFSKPFLPSELLAAVEEVLEAGVSLEGAERERE